ncbi:MAG TPA: response regulator transcription factor [Xanthobacteraceae bacterium]|nr:response regulator transcription factor [Xanthobacteraceae bacterium]
MRHRPFATILVGPSALLRHGLARILDAENFRVIASGAHVQDVAPTPQHQALLLVIDAGDEPNGALAEIALFKKQHPSGRVALLAESYVVGDMVSAFSAGANVCFAKSVSCDAFTKALELIMLGETILPPQLLAVIGSHRRDMDDSSAIIQKVHRNSSQPADSTPPLSAREKCILRCMADGDSNKLIARKIDIAEATVKVHVKAILRKIRVHNRTQAAIWAMNNGASLWPSVPSPQPLVDISPPASLVQDAQQEALQLPSPKAHFNHAKGPSLPNITSVLRKSVARRTQA